MKATITAVISVFINKYKYYKGRKLDLYTPSISKTNVATKTMHKHWRNNIISYMYKYIFLQLIWERY